MEAGRRLVETQAERVEEKKVKTLADKLAEVDSLALVDTLNDRPEEKQVLKLGYTCRGGGRGVLGHTG